MTLWDLAERPVEDRYAYWHDVLCEAFVPLVPRRHEPGDDFVGRVENRPLAALVRSRLGSQPQDTAHGPRQVAQTDEAHYFVNLQLEGRCHARQAGSEVWLEPGRVLVVDTTAPYWFEQPAPWRTLSYRVPKALVDDRLGGVRPALASPLDGGGCEAVVRALMDALWTTRPGTAAAAELTDAFCAAVAAALLSSAPPSESVREARRAQALRYARTHLADRNLGVESASRALGVSPRTLYADFDRAGETFGAAVRRLRLERSAALLADPGVSATVTEVASSVGLDDPSAFARAFRRRFGSSPSTWRAGSAQPACGD